MLHETNTIHHEIGRATGKCTFHQFFSTAPVSTGVDADIWEQVKAFLAAECSLGEDEVELADDFASLDLDERDIGFMARHFAKRYKFKINEEIESVFTLEEFVEWVEESIEE